VTLLGSGVLTLWVGLRAYRHDYRTLLLLATALMAVTGIGFAVLSDFWPLLLVAFVGTLNPSGGDVSVFLPLEHAMLARTADDHRRTALFARYSLAGTLAAAVGTLFAGLPDMVAAAALAPVKTALQAMFGLYALVGVLAAWIYRRLPPQRLAATPASDAPLEESKRRVLVLAAVSSCSRCSHFGCSKSTSYPRWRRGPYSSGPAYCRRCRIWWRPGSPAALAC